MQSVQRACNIYLSIFGENDLINFTGDCIEVVRFSYSMSSAVSSAEEREIGSKSHLSTYLSMWRWARILLRWCIFLIQRHWWFLLLGSVQSAGPKEFVDSPRRVCFVGVRYVLLIISISTYLSIL